MTSEVRGGAFEEGEKVWAPGPEEEKIKAIFLSIAVNEPVTVNGIPRSGAWISWEEGEDEGTPARVPYFRLRARDEG